MCFRKVKMFSREFGNITTLPVTTQPGNGVNLWQASGPMGTMIFTEFQDENYSIWHSEYQITTDTRITMQVPNDSSVGLAFILKRNFGYVHSLGAGVAKRNHYNLSYLPEAHCEYIFAKGDYATFGIQFTQEYIQRLDMDKFPLFTEFINKINEGIQARITDRHLFATSEMLTIINELLTFRYEGSLPKLFMKSKVVELLRLSLENISQRTAASRPLISASELKLMESVRDCILSKLDNPGTLAEIAQRAGLNQFRLKSSFKKAFGKSVIAFVHEERLNRAKAKIVETDLSMKSIAQIAGYKNLSNFATAFRKLFGYSPGTLKRGL